MVRIIQNAGFAALVACIGVAAALNGCSSAPEGSTAGAESVGMIGLELQVAGAALNQVSYTIVGPGSFTKSGTLDVTNSTTVSGLIGGLPVGSGYTITLSATTEDGATTCTGSASFNVLSHQTSVVTVHLLCHQAPTTGSVQVGGTLNVCPIADGITASPVEVLVGSTIALAVSAHDPDTGPSALSYAWTASAGTFDDATLAAPVFSCTTPGTVTVTVTVSDGDTAPGCTDSASATLACTPTAADVQNILDANCISCHSGPTPPRGLSLVDVRAVVGAAAVECPLKLRIAPGRADQSYLVDKIMGVAQDTGCFSGKQMPLNKPPLVASDIAIISSWINAGTP